MWQHNIDPVIIDFGMVAVKWYGISYLVGFAGAWLVGYLYSQRIGGWNKQQLLDLIFYSAWGAIIGGRLGYVLFYGFSYYLANPLEILQLWHGGMSFHGGMLGVIIAMIIFSRNTKRVVSEIIDLAAIMAPIALFCGRIGNFINGGLYGRVTDLPWGVVFPGSDGLPRHPSQIYEALLEGALLGIIIWWYAKKPRAPFNLSAIFLFGYGLARFIVEFVREPDQHLGFILYGWVTKGQLLSIPMIVIGLAVLLVNYLRQYKEK